MTTKQIVLIIIGAIVALTIISSCAVVTTIMAPQQTPVIQSEGFNDED